MTSTDGNLSMDWYPRSRSRKATTADASGRPRAACSSQAEKDQQVVPGLLAVLLRRLCLRLARSVRLDDDLVLSAHLVWHLRQAWAPLTFTDENRPEPADPVAPPTLTARRPQSRHQNHRRPAARPQHQQPAQAPRDPDPRPHPARRPQRGRLRPARHPDPAPRPSLRTPQHPHPQAPQVASNTKPANDKPADQRPTSRPRSRNFGLAGSSSPR